VGSTSPFWPEFLHESVGACHDPRVARLRIGELLVSGKFITQGQLDHALEMPRKEGQRIGDLLVERGLVTETQLTQLLGQQLSVPWVSLSHIEFSSQLLNLVPRDVAEKFGLVPIYVRRVRKQGDTLYVAMNDPTNDVALAEAAKVAGLPVRPMIAGQSDIRNAIRLYYALDGEAAPVAPSQPTPAQVPPSTPAQRPPLPTRAARTTPQPPPPKGGVSLPPEELIDEEEPAATPAVVVSSSGDSPDAAPEIEATEISLPKPKRQRTGSVGLSGLTLLDGTMIQFPKRPARKRADAPEALAGALAEITAKDLSAALRAATQSKDASAEDEGKWQPVFLAIFALLTRKGFVADREFLEELRKLA
jgi:type IV pilus assembly protein PilB